jgi:hypothetical protein
MGSAVQFWAPEQGLALLSSLEVATSIFYDKGFVIRPTLEVEGHPLSAVPISGPVSSIRIVTSHHGGVTRNALSRVSCTSRQPVQHRDLVPSNAEKVFFPGLFNETVASDN